MGGSQSKQRSTLLRWGGKGATSSWLWCHALLRLRLRLEPGNLINDNVVDFWISHFREKNLSDLDPNALHVFSAQFFTRMAMFPSATTAVPANTKVSKASKPPSKPMPKLTTRATSQLNATLTTRSGTGARRRRRRPTS